MRENEVEQKNEKDETAAFVPTMLLLCVTSVAMIKPKYLSNPVQQPLDGKGGKLFQSHGLCKNKNNRKFSVMHYKRRLPHGEEVCCKRVVHSVINNAVSAFAVNYLSKILVHQLHKMAV